MANDFKRMWTKAEVEQIIPKPVVDLPNIPISVGANSPDIIRVQGKLYYKKELTKDNVSDLTRTTWFFNETLNLEIYGDNQVDFYISFISKNDVGGFTRFITLSLLEGEEVSYFDEDDGGNSYYTTSDGWVYGSDTRKINITGGEDVSNPDLIAFLQANATLLSPNYVYVEVGDAESIQDEIDTKQDTLVSGTNIKTINGESVLGSGNIEIQGGGGTSENNFVFDIANVTDENEKSDLDKIYGNTIFALAGIATNGDLTLIPAEQRVKFVSITDIYTEDFADLANGLYDNFVLKGPLSHNNVGVILKKSASVFDDTGIGGGNSTYYNISSLRLYNGESLFTLSLTVCCTSEYISMNMTILDLLNG